MGSKLSQNEFIEKAKKVHGEKDMLDKAIYRGAYEKITLICPIHGEYEMVAHGYLTGKRCPKCSNRGVYTIDEVIEKARKIHGDKYNYDKVEHAQMTKKVTITCPIHGDFEKAWNSHLKGSGCPKCIGVGKTTEDFIKEYQEKYGTFYDLSKVEYKDALTKVCIICPKHGEFWATPHSLLTNNGGCKQCGLERVKEKNSLSEEEIVNRIREIHGDYYNLSRIKYTNMYDKIELVCPKHGSFMIRPHNLIDSKQGCRKCAYERNAERQKMTQDDFIKKAHDVHGDKYDYSKVDYNGLKEKVCIVCHEIDSITGKEHGEFYQSPSDHLNGCGCKKCTLNSYNYTPEEYKEKANIIHGNKYDYSQLPDKFENYSKEKITVVCPTHGEFRVKPYSHLMASGCPTCNESHLEKIVAFELDKNGIKYERQKKFDWLTSSKSIKNNRLTLDFYLPYYNVSIECQGRQHFISDEFFGGDYEFEEIKRRDSEKLECCIKHGVKMLYYTNVNLPKYPYDVITEMDTLINSIKGVLI